MTIKSSTFLSRGFSGKGEGWALGFLGLTQALWLLVSLSASFPSWASPGH